MHFFAPFTSPLHPRPVSHPTPIQQHGIMHPLPDLRLQNPTSATTNSEISALSISKAPITSSVCHQFSTSLKTSPTHLQSPPTSPLAPSSQFFYAKPDHQLQPLLPITSTNPNFIEEQSTYLRLSSQISPPSCPPQKWNASKETSFTAPSAPL